MIHRLSMIVMDTRPNPKLPPVLATLEPGEADFLERHIQVLRERAGAENAQQGRFRSSSRMPTILRRLTGAADDQFLKSCEQLAVQLKGSMAIATNPRQGIFVVATSGPVERAEIVSLLKLDADLEVAQWKRLTAGGVKLSVLQGCLPGPGSLQKGLSWPDPRTPVSDIIVQDRNLQNALYFLNAFEVEVSAKAAEVEKALHHQIAQLPPAQMKRALAAASTKSGPADKVAEELKAQFPALDTNRPEFGVGGMPGIVRPNKFAAQFATLEGSGIRIIVPIDKVTAVSEPTRVGDHWEVTVQFPARPRWK